jgi:hypothetical protein
MTCNDNETPSLYTRGLVSTLSVRGIYALFQCRFNARLFVVLTYQPHLVTWIEVAFRVTVSNFKELFRQSYHTYEASLTAVSHQTQITTYLQFLLPYGNF